jgi:addiction module HigA family antidote
MDKLNNIHPGEILKEEFLDPMGISQNRIAREIGVPLRRINEIVLCKRSVTADTALRLSRYLGTTAAFWLGLQTEYDMREASNRLGQVLEKIHPVSA